MARGDSSGSPRVPLRRLKTNRFKTLAARNNDAARRRAKYAVTKSAKDPESKWADIREARENGASWALIARVETERRALAQMYKAGIPTGDRGRELWNLVQSEPDIPDTSGYYHGDFG